MNRFRKNKKVKNDKEDSPGSPDSISALPFGSNFILSRKNKKQPEKPQQDLDFSLVLPSDDDFRTSLIMPKLSARFSMLREQNDHPANTKMGKASDDTVLTVNNRLSNRLSRMNMLGQLRTPLADIDEVASNLERGSFVRSGGPASFAESSAYATDDDGGRSPLATTIQGNGSVMDRPRPIEGNRFFSGRQEVYKIAVDESGRASGNGRVFYDSGLVDFTFLRPDIPKLQDITVRHSEDNSSNMSANRTTYSSTTSGPRGSTAATSLDEPSPQQQQSPPPPPVQQQQRDSTANGTAPTDAPKSTAPPSGSMMHRGPSVRSRRLYGQGLAQEHQEHQSCTLHRLDSLTRHRGGTPEPPKLNRSFSRSTTGLHERLQKLAIAEAADADNPVPAAAVSRSQKEQHEISQFSPAAAAAAAEAASSPSTPDTDDNALTAALKPEDRGKATALGLFNRPQAPYDESQFIRRQMQLRQNAPPTPPLSFSKPSSGGATSRNISANGSSSWIDESNNQRSASSSGASPQDDGKMFFVSNKSSGNNSDAENHPGRPSTANSFRTTPDDEHDGVVHARSIASACSYATAGSTTESPARSRAASPSRQTLPEERLSEISDTEDLDAAALGQGQQHQVRTVRRRDAPIFHEPTHTAAANSYDDHVVAKDDLDSPTLGRDDTFRTLPNFDERSSAVPPPLSISSVKERLPAASESSSLATSRQDELFMHRRDASAETQRERDEFASELANRRRRVEEKLRGGADVKIMGLSPEQQQHHSRPPMNVTPTTTKNRTAPVAARRQISQTDMRRNEPSSERNVSDDQFESSAAPAPNNGKTQRGTPPRQHQQQPGKASLGAAEHGSSSPVTPVRKAAPIPNHFDRQTRGRDVRKETASSPPSRPPPSRGNAAAAMSESSSSPGAMISPPRVATPTSTKKSPMSPPRSHSSHRRPSLGSSSSHHPGKRVVNKSQISGPTFIHSTSEIPSVSMPGAFPAAGAPPVPPMNPRRRRQTHIFGAFNKGDHHHNKQQLPSSSSTDYIEDTGPFVFVDERKSKMSKALRKISSEGGIKQRARMELHHHYHHTPPLPAQFSARQQQQRTAC